MTRDDLIEEALYAPTRRAIDTLRAVMYRPPVSPMTDDLVNRLIGHIAELLAHQRDLYARLRTKDEQIMELTRRLVG